MRWSSDSPPVLELIYMIDLFFENKEIDKLGFIETLNKQRKRKQQYLSDGNLIFKKIRAYYVCKDSKAMLPNDIARKYEISSAEVYRILTRNNLKPLRRNRTPNFINIE
jgi:Mor family transcriptional regulator